MTRRRGRRVAVVAGLVASLGGCGGGSPAGSGDGAGTSAPLPGAPPSASTPDQPPPPSAAGPTEPPAPPATTTPAPVPAPAPPPPTPGWVTVAFEDFEHLDPGTPAWQRDPVPDDGPFSDGGVYFTRQGITPPAAFRLSQPLGASGWLVAESYTRDASRAFSQLVSVVPDPADPTHRVLQIASPAHTDATVIRSAAPLPRRYRVSLRVGFPSFGDGLPGLNGYATGQETAEPWSAESAVPQNGFYWLAILDAQPRPHDNVWIHHHRKVVFDSDNNYPPWMEIFDGQRFLESGEHPLMMFALDGKGPTAERTGKPFLAWSGAAWQRDLVRAVDAYLPDTWYRVSIERFDSQFTLEVSGRFRFGGDATYRATLDAAQACVWHFNRTADEDASACLDPSPYPSLGPEFPQWPAGATWPDFFMFGDPHVNYYMGRVLYDDVKLEEWR